MLIEFVDLGILCRGRNQAAIVLVLKETNFLRWFDTHGHDPGYRGNRLQAFKVRPGESINCDATRRGRSIVTRFDAADDDVRRPLALDVIEGSLHRPFANPHEDDNGPDANDDAEHGKESSQLVQIKAA